jgi:hypothetical protein
VVVVAVEAAAAAVATAVVIVMVVVVVAVVVVFIFCLLCLSIVITSAFFCGSTEHYLVPASLLMVTLWMHIIQILEKYILIVLIVVFISTILSHININKSFFMYLFM